MQENETKTNMVLAQHVRKIVIILLLLLNNFASALASDLWKGKIVLNKVFKWEGNAYLGRKGYTDWRVTLPRELGNSAGRVTRVQEAILSASV